MGQRLPFTLRPETAEKLRKMIEQAGQLHEGLRLTRADIVNFIINQHSPQLSKKELNTLRNTHFDTEQQLKWALQQAKAAKKHGEPFSINQVICKPTSRSHKPHTLPSSKKHSSEGFGSKQ